MTIYNVHDAKTHFSKLLELVVNGEEVVIAKAGKPVARILPFVAQGFSPRVPGIDKGKVLILPDFDAPLPDFDL
jgi:prevent-host-death family protein